LNQPPLRGPNSVVSGHGMNPCSTVIVLAKPWASRPTRILSLSDHQTMESQSRRNDRSSLDIHTSEGSRATQSSCVFDGSYSRLLIGTSGMPVLHRHHCELKPPRGLVGVMIMVTEGHIRPRAGYPVAPNAASARTTSIGSLLSFNSTDNR